MRKTKGAAAPFFHRPARGRSRVGLAMAGGGPLGATWEVGALCALEEAIPGLDFTDLDGYVGVSSGSFIAAALANGMRPRMLCASFIENDPAVAADIVSPTLFVRPAVGELLARLVSLPLLATQAGWQLALGRRSFIATIERLGRALPTGLFSHAPLEARLREVFSAAGRSNDFRQLKQRVVLVATDLDSGEAAPFGQPGWDHVPISRAVAASAALPGLFPPVAIGGRWYVDGALKKTLHARVLLDQGLDLLLCLNPLVPFDATHAPRHRVLGANGRIPQIVQGGLPLVLSQTFRTLIHSRLELGLKGYEASHPDTDIVLFEPDQRDPDMFLANILSYSQRRELAEHAYQKTREDLRSRRSSIGAMLARHGLALDDAALDDPRRHLVEPRGPRFTALARPLQRLDEVLDDLEQALAAAA
ncbi:patatin-like phospholipase family protein [Aquincola sp. S2]|uniref:Patatin-like phospholipase family protein n=1 Tax=Pseudaquabacterium terrae TaxID=2732868 RepID=A0ABX2ESF8_9BURK|nr:patatin-like phospholipase family protein [Aquabacterium terrae]NRF71452.1 patatin-like phospholipase family protein [Aquabacterium terrae]